MLTITPATREDVTAIAELLDELDCFYGATDVEPPQRRVPQIEMELFGVSPAARVLLARDGAEVVGLASYSFLWPAAGVTRSLFLKELYVRQSRRGEGLGRALMRALCEVAVEAGASRVEWHADDVNVAAQRFYRSLGAPIDQSKMFYRLNGEGIARLVDS